MMIPIGSIAQVRSRQYLIEQVEPPQSPGGDTQVRLVCVDDDAQGEELEVFWERELDARVLGKAAWDSFASKGFDNPRYFSAYLHTLRWNCVTSTKDNLFQSPYRAGIQVKAYQLEPLRKALQMPRIGLFIADDVGLGKTIEAGLILREMLLRQKIQRVVIACPPSVVRQWQEEMENRFGLTFMLFDRQFMMAKRSERGYHINPWTTHTRFIISHALLRDETYAAPLRDWLGDFATGSMLILDEAHNAAPASGSQYAIDSQLTQTVRDVAPRFEHKLFLSATPHNGHSNSFAALLEMLDPQRFCRGVPVKSKQLLDSVMVRRLKRDLREIGDRDFPQREVIPLSIDGLPRDAPELLLSRLLKDYRQAREQRLKERPKSQRRASMLVVTSLQKRLLSSIEAFARTLAVHRHALERQQQRSQNRQTFALLRESVGADDDRAELSEAEVEAEEDAQMTTASQADAGDITEEEWKLLDHMTEIANRARHQPDARMKRLIAWIQENLCPDLGGTGATWGDRRLLIFTEYTDTKRYLEQQLQQAIAGSSQENARIGSFHGGMGDDRREAIKRAFNAPPSDHPLRILIATDAAREGVNLQNYCADLFHFDVPWNPSRMEQRNGRIDRKLQRSPLVRCYYFTLPQRAEDRVLDVLVRKTETIISELGSLSPVVEKNIGELLDEGIDHGEQLPLALESIDHGDETSQRHLGSIREELEVVRPEIAKLRQQEQTLQNLLRESQQWLGLEAQQFRETLSAALELLGASPLTPLNPEQAAQNPEQAPWQFPQLSELTGDATWTETLDSLREPRPSGQSLWEWRKETQVRPVVFRDPGLLDNSKVHLHLEHRVVQRLLGRFTAQGFVYDELNRACICLSDDPVPKVMLLGRLSLYGDRASRLHDEVIAVTAEWSDPASRGRSQLRPLDPHRQNDALRDLETALVSPRLRQVSEGLKERLKPAVATDIEQLLPHLEEQAIALEAEAAEALKDRGQRESRRMRDLLKRQQERIRKREQEVNGQLESTSSAQQLELDLKTLSKPEQKQLEADRRYWMRRLVQLEDELEREPARIRASYEIKAKRLEPVGLVYLWGVSS
jgi:ERCC4-related helicase